MKQCPICNINILHYRGHGDHTIVCKGCNILFCYLCLFVFRERSPSSDLNSNSSSSYSLYSNSSSSSSYSDSSSSFNSCSNTRSHYAFSNCSEQCDEVCCCKSCPACLVLLYTKHKHCKDCSITHCTRYNGDLEVVKKYITENK